MEFLRLEQGDMLVGEYAAKFEELVWFCPYSELEVDEWSKCSKFESGLRPKLKKMFGHQEIADFATLDDLKKDEVATPKSIPPRNYGPQRNHMQGESWKSCLSERFSPERERITWEGEILGYTGRFSPERELPRLGEKWQTGAVDTVRFSLEREGQI
ncbi:hypothetical protein Lal_00033753 [Lupinus albus]|nr:hypothetical protein Lal_00033753 [Lupinus albus]